MQRLVFFFLLVYPSISCTKTYTPKPCGFMRIEPPVAQHSYLETEQLPCSFLVSQYAIIDILPDEKESRRQMSIEYPALNAKIYCSYQTIRKQTFYSHAENYRKFLKQTTKRITAIKEKAYENEDEKVYGSLFLTEGESASPIQFVLTDSTSHFFNGALYYQCRYNADSLAPITDYIKKDIIKLIQSFYWKK